MAEEQVKSNNAGYVEGQQTTFEKIQSGQYDAETKAFKQAAAGGSSGVTYERLAKIAEERPSEISYVQNKYVSGDVHRPIQNIAGSQAVISQAERAGYVQQGNGLRFTQTSTPEQQKAIIASLRMQGMDVEQQAGVIRYVDTTKQEREAQFKEDQAKYNVSLAPTAPTQKEFQVANVSYKIVQPPQEPGSKAGFSPFPERAEQAEQPGLNQIVQAVASDIITNIGYLYNPSEAIKKTTERTAKAREPYKDLKASGKGGLIGDVIIESVAAVKGAAPATSKIGEKLVSQGIDVTKKELETGRPIIIAELPVIGAIKTPEGFRVSSGVSDVIAVAGYSLRYGTEAYFAGQAFGGLGVAGAKALAGPAASVGAGVLAYAGSPTRIITQVLPVSKPVAEAGAILTGGAVVSSYVGAKTGVTKGTPLYSFGTSVGKVAEDYARFATFTSSEDVTRGFTEFGLAMRGVEVVGKGVSYMTPSISSSPVIRSTVGGLIGAGLVSEKIGRGEGLSSALGQSYGELVLFKDVYTTPASVVSRTTQTEVALKERGVGVRLPYSAYGKEWGRAYQEGITREGVLKGKEELKEIEKAETEQFKRESMSKEGQRLISGFESLSRYANTEYLASATPSTPKQEFLVETGKPEKIIKGFGETKVFEEKGSERTEVERGKERETQTKERQVQIEKTELKEKTREEIKTKEDVRKVTEVRVLPERDYIERIRVLPERSKGVIKETSDYGRLEMVRQDTGVTPKPDESGSRDISKVKTDVRTDTYSKEVTIIEKTGSSALLTAPVFPGLLGSPGTSYSPSGGGGSGETARGTKVNTPASIRDLFTVSMELQVLGKKSYKDVIAMSEKTNNAMPKKKVKPERAGKSTSITELIRKTGVYGKK